VTVHIIPVEGIGEVRHGDDLGDLIRAATARAEAALQDDDVVVVSSKVVAKAAGLTLRPAAGEDTEAARRRLSLTHEVLVETPHVVVVRTPSGLVCANAGIDASNVPGGELLLLPEDPDAEAEAIRVALADVARVGVVVADTFGRAWREGQTDVALGVAGMAALRDERGTADRDGRPLSVTLVALADQVAGAADLVRDKAAGVPVVIVRGLRGVVGAPGRAADLVRSDATDLFPHGRGWLARRLATGEGRAMRTGPPAEWEWDLVRAAVGPEQATVEGDRLTTAEGYAAAIAQACLLDLGYDVQVRHEDGAYRVVAGP
jgi:coenzyme F420-0:L-glutamate ligase/coenzyme F420-1:gamma-L-glutamate ligase